MSTVRIVLRSKGAAVVSVDPNSTVLQALTLMAEKNVGALLVTSGTNVVGIFSERDYARKVALKGKAAETTMVADVMTSDVVTVTSDHTMEACMTLITEKHIRHLPVIDDGALSGMISIGDVVKSVLSEKERTIQDLTNYISGSRA